MEAKDWIIIVAVLVAPILAVQVQKWTERFRERQGRKLRIFHTLMSTRMARLSPYHVEALNMIDTEFYSTTLSRVLGRRKKEQAVVDAWTSYLDHLNSLSEKPTDAELQTWSTHKDDLFIELLFQMSRCVGYDFDRVHLKRSIYSPRAHGDEELDQRMIRENLVAITSGNKALPMTLVVSDESLKSQNALQASLLEFYDGKRSIRVKIDSDSPEDKQQVPPSIKR
jgi:hypothetical protein